MAPVEVVWTNLAREGLLGIYVAIGLENPSAAERTFDRIELRAGLLADQPRTGARRPDIRPSARVLVEPPYRIFYETIPDTDVGPVSQGQIVTVVDGCRNLLPGFF
ncbi:MAG: type II toxin-antitoxin system RelE/ParE family toxin [Parafilimonas terrae]|nr:type II toxin-antitoxin system RelE/ParE family toxin [Parafilimonas terrae]